MGVAYRDTATNLWNVLARYEYQTDFNNAPITGSDSRSQIVSVSADYHPVRAWEFEGQVAAKAVHELLAQTLPDNPHVHFFESRQRGYVCVDLERTHMQARMRIVSDVKDPKAGISTLRTFAVEGGRPGVVAA